MQNNKEIMQNRLGRIRDGQQYTFHITDSNVPGDFLFGGFSGHMQISKRRIFSDIYDFDRFLSVFLIVPVYCASDEAAAAAAVSAQRDMAGCFDLRCIDFAGREQKELEEGTASQKNQRIQSGSSNPDSGNPYPDYFYHK